MESFVKERNAAFIEAVENDNWEPVIKYCKKYGVEIPESKMVFELSIYKAVQECTNIPERTKLKAALICNAVGMYSNNKDGAQ